MFVATTWDFQQGQECSVKNFERYIPNISMVCQLSPIYGMYRDIRVERAILLCLIGKSPKVKFK